MKHTVVATPLRVSLLGGGADFPELIKLRPRNVFGMAINKYIHFNAYPMPEVVPSRHRFQYSQTEEFSNIDDIKHPVIRAVLSELAPKNYINVAIASDLPGGSGLGSSSTFTCGLLHLIRHLNAYPHHPNLLAAHTIRLEQDVLKEVVGVQDQIYAALGNVQLIRLYETNFSQISISNNFEEIINRLYNESFLIFTDSLRSSSETQKSFDSGKKLESINKISEIADYFADNVCDAKYVWELLAECVNESWKEKSKYCISDDFIFINELVSEALANGALFAKLLGAGNGGFVFCSVPKDKQKDFLCYFKNKKVIQIKPSNYGSQAYEVRE